MEHVLASYGITDVISIAPYGEGHINETYLVKTESKDYILQKINTHVFLDVDLLMANIEHVITHLNQKQKTMSLPSSWQTLKLIATIEGKNHHSDESGRYRLYDFVYPSLTLQQGSPEALRASGKAFGLFQAMLHDFDIALLKETIPDFHDTEKRYLAFLKAIENTNEIRRNKAQCVIDEVKARRHYSSAIVSKLKAGSVPLRVTHNDTKLNNVLFDLKGIEGICVIDLDTVMPGSLCYDFGDAIRFGCNTAKEDETDLRRIRFDFECFKAFTEGFVEPIKHTMTDSEVDLLALSAIVMTYEVGMRFLTDYLNHDIYFKTKYDTHNLDRAINQMTLVKAMEDALPLMEAFVQTLQRQG